MEKLVLKCPLPPGDILMLTAAVRDLHRNYPGRFVTDVRTQHVELWDNNPYITKLDEDERLLQVIDCGYPLIRKANLVPAHFLCGFVQHLNEQLHLNIELTEFKGDIHLSEKEQLNSSPLAERFSYNAPYWIIVSGGKQDFTIKWWDHKRCQRIVDHFKGKIQFVQTGAAGHFHPELEGVFDLRGRTSLRELIRLMHHASGVICPVTFTMHLSAAVPMTQPHRLRPTIVIAGGREPVHWESYPGHQFLHTIGMLPCCRVGGCWRARTKPLRDNSHLNRSEYLCVDTVGDLPRCMDMITADEVIAKVESHIAGEARFAQLVDAERAKMQPDGRKTDQVGRINIPYVHSFDGVSVNGDTKDLLLKHYRHAERSPKRTLRDDLSNHALSNIPQGLGDTILLTQLPRVASLQKKVRYIDSSSPFFEALMKFNPHYQPAHDRERIAANVLQYKYDLGNGHFIQRLQRAFSLDPVLLPKGHVNHPCRPKPGRVIIHFEAGSTHAAWQRIYVHPRARQLYPESQRIVQNFIDSHPEMSFCQIGSHPVQLQNVEDGTNRPLEDTIELMADGEYFLGIVSGPMHLATALGLRCIVILNFPHAHEILLPTLKDVDLIESEWLYPQNVHLHQESEGPLVKRLNTRTLEMAFGGDLYPYWHQDFLSLIYETL